MTTDAHRAEAHALLTACVWDANEMPGATELVAAALAAAEDRGAERAKAVREALVKAREHIDRFHAEYGKAAKRQYELLAAIDAALDPAP